MTVSTEKISLGSADATYKGVDLGATKGGVEVEIKTETYEVKVDQTGETPVKEIITGTVVTVKVPMAETDLDKLKLMMPQSVATEVSGALPTGYMVNNVAGYAAGASQVAIDAGANTPEPGVTFTFSGHNTVYRVVAFESGSGVVTFVQNAGGVGGLVALVADDEPVTFVARASGIEIRTGVNIDLYQHAGELKLHPTGMSPAITEQDFTAFKAAPSANFSFKYEQGSERVYEVEFKCYPDTTNNNRIASFGQVA